MSEVKKAFDTRVAHESLIKGLLLIKESLDTTSLERKVEIGSVLWDFGDAVGDVLNQIKKDVRSAAISRLQGRVGSTLLEGEDLGEATVNIPESSLRVPKGTNIDDLKEVLGSEFSLFFEETVTVKPRKEFEERVTMLQNPLHKQILNNAVVQVEPTPRVSFRRHKLSQREES